MSESQELHEQGADRSRVLVANGAPWRPYSDEGVLVAAAAAPRTTAEILAVAERSLMTHLKAACLWPEAERGRSWDIGDYAYYILSFKPVPDAAIYVQCWSDSGDDGRLLVEVSSGHRHAPAERYVDATRQALLRERGFEIGGNASNFRKRIVVADETELRAFARKAVAILSTELGLDGTRPLRFKLHLGSVLAMRRTLDAIEPQLMLQLMHDWGYPTRRLRTPDGAPMIASRCGAGSIWIGFKQPRKEGGQQFQRLLLGAVRRGPGTHDAALERANEINRRWSGLQASIDQDGDLVLEAEVLLYGGVTLEHVRMRIDLFRRSVEVIAEGGA